MDYRVVCSGEDKGGQPLTEKKRMKVKSTRGEEKKIRWQREGNGPIYGMFQLPDGLKSEAASDCFAR